MKWDNGPSVGGFCAPMGVTPANPSNSTDTTCGPAAQGVPRLACTPEHIAAYNAASLPAADAAEVSVENVYPEVLPWSTPRSA